MIKCLVTNILVIAVQNPMRKGPDWKAGKSDKNLGWQASKKLHETEIAIMIVLVEGEADWRFFEQNRLIIQ